MLKFRGIVFFLKQIWMGALSVANSVELVEEIVDSVEVVEETFDDVVKSCTMPCFGCLLLYGQLYSSILFNHCRFNAPNLSI